MSQAAKLAEEWDRRVAKIARNLTDFTDSDAARLVRARTASYAGRTREAAERVEAALTGLQDDYLVLYGVVSDAVRASRRTGLLQIGSRDAEVSDLLEGESVQLRTLSVPIARRGLLDEAEAHSRLTPAAVLASMERTFTEARDVVNAIAEAEETLAGRIAAAGARAAALAGWEGATCIPIGADDLAGKDLIGLERDPLEAGARLDRVESALAAAEARREKADAALAAIRDRLAAAGRGLDVLREAYKAFGTAAGALGAVDAPAPAAARDEAGELADWLGSLRRIVARGDLGPAGVGLGKWEASLAAARASAESALAAARAPVAELEDLRGLLRALRAKGAALGGPAAEEERLAKEALRAEPVRLGAAGAAVKAYEVALAAAGASRKAG